MPAKKMRGLTLIEVIIGLLLLASCGIGVAAIYAQQEHSLRGGRLHAVAAKLSDNIAVLIHREHDRSVNFETGLGHTCNNSQSLHDSENEIACWQEDVARKLPNGSARITLDSNTAPPQYIITISWTDPRTGTASYVQRVAN